MSELGQVTCGDFKTEKEAEFFFDSNLSKKFFINEKEVRGRRLFDDKPVKDIGGQNVRVDRIIHPTKEAVESGWIYGPIAIEIKKSNMALGPVFAQIFEYRQSVFQSRVLGFARIMPICFAIFPMRKITHDLHSLSESQLILSCSKEYNGGLHFGTHGKTAFVVKNDSLNLGSFSPTNRKGHRGREKNG